jgi:hypothetical protein
MRKVLCVTGIERGTAPFQTILIVRPPPKLGSGSWRPMPPCPAAGSAWVGHRMAAMGPIYAAVDGVISHHVFIAALRSLRCSAVLARLR